MDDKREADLWLRDSVSQRLTAIETTQKLYHDEIKSIIESFHKEIGAIKDSEKILFETLYGGPPDKVGLLERFRSLLAKAGMATTLGFGLISLLLKIFGPSVNKAALKMIGEDPVSRFQYEQSKKRLRVWNANLKRYEYYIEFTPVGEKAK